MSRLARNNADWHRLLEICALTETLILDEDGLTPHQIGVPPTVTLLPIVQVTQRDIR